MPSCTCDDIDKRFSSSPRNRAQFLTANIKNAAEIPNRNFYYKIISYYKLLQISLRYCNECTHKYSPILFNTPKSYDFYYLVLTVLPICLFQVPSCGGYKPLSCNSFHKFLLQLKSEIFPSLTSPAVYVTFSGFFDMVLIFAK